MSQRFCQTINNHFFGKYVHKIDLTYSDLLLNVMMLNITVFCFQLEDKVVSNINKTLIIFFQRYYTGNKIQFFSFF